MYRRLVAIVVAVLIMACGAYPALALTLNGGRQNNSSDGSENAKVSYTDIYFSNTTNRDMVVTPENATDFYGAFWSDADDSSGRIVGSGFDQPFTIKPGKKMKLILHRKVWRKASNLAINIHTRVMSGNKQLAYNFSRFHSSSKTAFPAWRADIGDSQIQSGGCIYVDSYSERVSDQVTRSTLEWMGLKPDSFWYKAAFSVISNNFKRGKSKVIECHTEYSVMFTETRIIKGEITPQFHDGIKAKDGLSVSGVSGSSSARKMSLKKITAR